MELLLCQSVFGTHHLTLQLTTTLVTRNLSAHLLMSLNMDFNFFDAPYGTCLFDSTEGTDAFVSSALTSFPSTPLPPLPVPASLPNYSQDPVTLPPAPTTPSPAPSKAVLKSSKLFRVSKHTTPFSAKELFEVMQAALNVKIFETKFGKKGERKKEMGDKICGHGILGSNGIFETHMLELLTWHEVCIWATIM